MAITAPRGYTRTQVGLHWLIAVLTIVQLVFGESMATTFDALQEGRTPTASDEVWANVHIIVGCVVLAAVLVRLLLRIRLGVPLVPETEHPALRVLAKAVHAAFYVVLIAMPITGVLSYWWFPGLSGAHVVGKPILIGLLALHVAGAVWHHVYWRDDVLVRMFKPLPD